MCKRIVVFAAVVAGASALAHAQPYDVGKAVSTDLLLRLTRPTEASGAIGIVHADLASGMVVPRHASSPSVEYFRGDTWLWMQAAEQLSKASIPDGRIHLEIKRWRLDATSCPMMPSRLESFIAELDKVVSDPLGDSDASSTEPTMVLDAPRFLIQVTTKNATLTITPSGLSNTPLHQAAGYLHSTVSGCAASLKPTVEQHAF